MALDYKSSLSRYRRYLQMVQSQPLWTASLWVIMSLVLLIVLLVLALRPTLVTIADLLGKINQQKTVSRQLEDRILAVQNAISRLDAENNRLALLDTALPEEAEWSRLAGSLEAMATESGIRLENLTINKIPLTPTEVAGNKSDRQTTNIPTGVIPVRFIIIAEGDYESLRNLVAKIENKRRVTILTGAQMEITKTGATRLTLQGETGYLPERFTL